MLHFEDFTVGQLFSNGPRVVEREEMVAFARRYDPQPFHVDDEAAEVSIYGGLIASGYLTAAIGHALLIEAFVAGSASLGSPGIDELRWLAPVRPGMALTARAEVIEVRASRSRPDRGFVKLRSTLEAGDLTVMTMVSTGMFRRRATQLQGP